jgi:hypothetical protein
MEFPIKEVRIIDNKAVVIFKDSDLSPEFSQFMNCRAFDENGLLIWVAEHPTSELTDFYMLVVDTEKNKLRNFASYTCQLDFSTGKLLDIECM